VRWFWLKCALTNRGIESNPLPCPLGEDERDVIFDEAMKEVASFKTLRPLFLESENGNYV
jgi:hypothetical protein